MSQEIKLPKISEGSFVRVRVRLAREQLTLWPEIRRKIIAWAKNQQIGVLVGPSLEIAPSGVPDAAPGVQFLREKMQPNVVLSRFADRHLLKPDLTDVGFAILGEATNGQ